MRLLFFVLALPVIVPAATMAQGPAPSVESPQNIEKAAAAVKDACRKTTSYSAEAGSAWRGDPLKPRKLNELPPATGYKAVYRVVNGCEEPLTVAEYQRTIVR